MKIPNLTQSVRLGRLEAGRPRLDGIEMSKKKGTCYKHHHCKGASGDPMTKAQCCRHSSGSSWRETGSDQCEQC